MKIHCYLVFVACLSLGCAAQQDQDQDLPYTILTYTASSRGLYEDIALTSENISVLKERSSELRTEASMPEEEWEIILKMCKALPKNIIALDADKLAVDAAIKGTLTLKRNNNRADETIIVIDHSNVPEEMRPLINKIKALSNLVE